MAKPATPSRAMSSSVKRGPPRQIKTVLPQWVLRVASATVLIPLTLYLIWFQPVLFSGFIWLWVIIGWLEWLQMMSRRQTIPADLRWLSIAMLVGVAAFNAVATITYAIGIISFGAIMLAVLATRARVSASWLSGGFIYLTIGAIAMLYLRQNYTIGAALVTFLFGIVWATDTGSYVFGRLLGGAKLLPAISPSKTWAGFYGGLVVALLTALLIGYYLNRDSKSLELLGWQLAGFGAMALALALMAQMGDWFESWVKRQHRVKDAGDIIPGHGGVLDRIDSLLITAPFYLIAILVAHRALPF